MLGWKEARKLAWKDVGTKGRKEGRKEVYKD